jgi:predicted acyl esterase
VEAAARLADVAPELEAILCGRTDAPPLHPADAITTETVRMETRDGLGLATDVYLPPVTPAPVVAMRTPYGRTGLAPVANLVDFARRGYVAVAQDVRGTGDSEPDVWDFGIYEDDDGIDFVAWVVRQAWYGGFVGSWGGSYVGGTQWRMGAHPAMSAIAPHVAGLGSSRVTRPGFHMFMDAYKRAVGRDAELADVGFDELERLLFDETLASGYYAEPLYRPLPETFRAEHPELDGLSPAETQRALFAHYRTLPTAERAGFLKSALGEDRITFEIYDLAAGLFGHGVPRYNAVLRPDLPSGPPLARSVHAAPLIITGWYDWAMDDSFAAFELLRGDGLDSTKTRARLLVTPASHRTPGYREHAAGHPELELTWDMTTPFAETPALRELLVHWFAAVRTDALESWPPVVYYLMGANEWRAAVDWPPPDHARRSLYLTAGGGLAEDPPGAPSEPDRYVYDPTDPTPTVGGSIVTAVLTPGSCDVHEIQQRPDVVTYTTPVLEADLDVAGPVRLVLYASSSAVDTDFSARLSDVFPDGRAIQLQHTTLRTRYRDPSGEPLALEPGRIYRLELDLWATANRFEAGHRLRLDLSSADFPKFDRHANRIDPGPPLRAEQRIYHDAAHPSELVFFASP